MPTTTIFAVENGQRKSLASARDDDPSQKAIFVAAQARAINEAILRGAATPTFEVKTHKDEYDLPFEDRHEKTLPLPHEAEAHAKWKAGNVSKLEEVTQ